MRTLVVAVGTLSLLASLGGQRKRAVPGETVEGAVVVPRGPVETWATRFVPLDDPGAAFHGEGVPKVEGVRRWHRTDRTTVLSSIRHAEKIVIALQGFQVRQLAHLALGERLRAINPHSQILVSQFDKSQDAFPLAEFDSHRRHSNITALMSAMWRHGRSTSKFESFGRMVQIDERMSPMVVAVALCLQADPVTAADGLELERSLARGIGSRDNPLRCYGLLEHGPRRQGAAKLSGWGTMLARGIAPDNIDPGLCGKIEDWSRMDLAAMRDAIDSYRVEFLAKQSSFRLRMAAQQESAWAASPRRSQP